MTDYSLYKKDPVMLYETFLRRVYHCGRGDDPFGLANTDLYSSEGNDMLSIYSIVGIWTALNLLKAQIKDPEQKAIVYKMIDQFEKNPTSMYFIRVSKEIFILLEACEIYEFPHSNSLQYNNS